MSDQKKQLMHQFSHAVRLIGRRRHRNRRGANPFEDTSRGQGRVLALLSIQPEMSQKDLAYLLGIRNQSISELVVKLEKAGLVEKNPSDEDKRLVNVKLTEKGKEVAGETQDKRESSSGIFDCLSEEEQKTLSDYLSRIIAALEEEMGEEDFLTDDPDQRMEALREHFKKFHSEEGSEDFEKEFEAFFKAHRGHRGDFSGGHECRGHGFDGRGHGRGHGRGRSHGCGQEHDQGYGHGHGRGHSDGEECCGHHHGQGHGSRGHHQPEEHTSSSDDTSSKSE